MVCEKGCKSRRSRVFSFGDVGRLVLAVWLAGVLGLAVMACSRQPSEITVQLIEQEGSGQSDIATLTAKDGQTEVFIKVDAGPIANDPQPVHIHFGGCGLTLGDVHYPLNDLEAGASISLVDATLVSLMDGNNVFNVHKSYPEISIYTSCGDIPPQ